MAITEREEWREGVREEREKERTNVGETVEILEPLHIPDSKVNGTAAVENNVTILHIITMGSTDAISGYITKRKSKGMKTNINSNMMYISQKVEAT